MNMKIGVVNSLPTSLVNNEWDVPPNSLLLYVCASHPTYHCSNIPKAQDELTIIFTHGILSMFYGSPPQILSPMRSSWILHVIAFDRKYLLPPIVQDM